MYRLDGLVRSNGKTLYWSAKFHKELIRDGEYSPVNVVIEDLVLDGTDDSVLPTKEIYDDIVENISERLIA